MDAQKSRTGLYIRLVISLLLLVFVFSFADITQIGDVITRIDYWFFALVAAITLVDSMMMAYKWQRLVLIKNIGLSFNLALVTYLVSGFVGLVLPTGIGADIYRVHYTSKLLGGLKHIASSVVIERLLGMLASTIFAVIGVLVMSIAAPESKIDENILLQIFIVLAVVNVLFFMLMTENFFTLVKRLLDKLGNKIIGDKILSFHQAYMEYGNHKQALSVFFALSFIEQVFFVAITYFAALAIEVKIEWYYFIGIVPVCQILKKIPISVNSIGVQEGLFAFFFSQIGMTVTEALSLSILIRIAQWIMFFAGGVLYVLGSKESINVEAVQSKRQ